MKVQLIKLEPQLAAKNIETAKLMKILVEEKSAADDVRTVVLADEALAKVCLTFSRKIFAYRDL